MSSRNMYAPNRCTEVSLESLTIIRLLGHGVSGQVFLAYDSKNRRQIALKIIKKCDISNTTEIIRLKQERNINSELCHPFLVSMFFSLSTANHYIMGFEYCAGGDMFHHRVRWGTLSVDLVRFYAAELVVALGYLHAQGIAYRDLKPENIMLDAVGHIRLVDMGLCASEVGVTRGARSICGTAFYVAPEVLFASAARAGEEYGTAVDWWALGMIMYEWFTGYPPWYNTNIRKMHRAVRSSALPFSTPRQLAIPADAKDLISELLQKNPTHRLGAGPSGEQELQRHPFFASIDWRELEVKQTTPPFCPCPGLTGQRGQDSSLKADASCQNFDAELTSTQLSSVLDAIPTRLHPRPPPSSRSSSSSSSEEGGGAAEGRGGGEKGGEGGEEEGSEDCFDGFDFCAAGYDARPLLLGRTGADEEEDTETEAGAEREDNTTTEPEPEAATKTRTEPEPDACTAVEAPASPSDTDSSSPPSISSRTPSLSSSPESSAPAPVPAPAAKRSSTTRRLFGGLRATAASATSAAVVPVTTTTTSAPSAPAVAVPLANEGPLPPKMQVTTRSAGVSPPTSPTLLPRRNKPARRRSLFSKFSSSSSNSSSKQQPLTTPPQPALSAAAAAMAAAEAEAEATANRLRLFTSCALDLGAPELQTNKLSAPFGGKGKGKGRRSLSRASTDVDSSSSTTGSSYYHPHHPLGGGSGGVASDAWSGGVICSLDEESV